MNRKYSLALTLPIMSLCFSLLHAQGGPPRGGVAFVGPDPQGNIFFVNFQAGLGNKTVSGAPYCAQITSEFIQTLQDGNKIDRKNVTNVCRDGQGRTWRQGGLPAIGQFSPANAPQFIFINDPVAGVSYVLDPAKKTAQKTVRRNLQGGPGRGPGRGPGGPPPVGPNGPQRGGNNNNVSNQSLGQQNIEGILVNGTLVTRTIPAGRVGNQSPIQVTSERWYSPDLQIDLLVKDSNPQNGQNTTTFSNINRSEPDSSIFQVPGDYTVTSGGGRGGRGPRPPAPPPQQ